MNGVQLAILAGAMVGAGIACLVWWWAPAHPDLAAALDRLAPERSLARPEGAPPARTAPDRVGLWAMRTLPVRAWVRTPVKELTLLRVPVHRHYGQKVLYFVLGLGFPATAVALLALLGITLPVAVPLVASLALAVALSFLPDYNARADAAKARAEFARALAAYVDMVALERNAGAGPRQALEVAAGTGDSWVFRRLSEELTRSRWSGVPPWDALRDLAEDLGLPELAEVADIMRLSGEEGAAIYATLRSRSASMRAAQTSAALATANAAGERMSMPVAVLAMVFLALLAVPALLRVLLPGA